MRVLAADLGGTSLRLALFEVGAGGTEELNTAVYRSADHSNLASALQLFLDGAWVDRAGIGVAGPVIDGRCDTTNLPWSIDAHALETDLGIDRVWLVNDFEAIAHGIARLGPGDLAWLQPNDPDPDGVVTVLGAGTGLGQACVLRSPTGDTVMPTEGGHADFAPRTEREIGLLRFLMQRHGHVSCERVLSGPGLVSIYEYVIAAGLAPPQRSPSEVLAAPDPAALIGKVALTGSDGACRLAVDIFVGVYGAEAANLALKSLPRGGVFVAGGIAPKLLPLFRPGFMNAFLDKGRMRPLLERFPVAVVTHARVGLLGALSVALASDE